ncbi:MAG TPA: glycosyltransferase [Longimicrobiales bacterium]
MALVTATIVNWNTRDALRRCLDALTRARAAQDLEIIVVDNASEDGSADMVEREFPAVRLLRSPVNGGFAAGNNAALEHATGEYVLILNPDVEIGAHAIAALVAFLESTPRAAAVSPLLAGPDGRAHTHLYRRFPSLAQIVLFWTVLSPVSRRIPWLTRRFFEHDLDARGPIAVDQLPGAAMLVRRTAFEDIGRLDPDYFMWFEDVDWCYRARSAGHGLYVLPDVRAVHAGGASFDSWGLGKRVHQFYRAFARFLCKHRLDRLRRLAIPILTFDLWIKEIALRVVSPFSSARDRDGLRAARRAVRTAVALYRSGELIRYTEAGLDRASTRGARTDPGTRDGGPGRSPSGTHTGTAIAPVVAAPPTDGGVRRARIDAIIVNWNGRRYLPACIRSLRESTVPVRIIVVDNASTDGSAAYVRTEVAEAELVALDANIGYAAGANAGLARGDAPYAIVLNPDVVLAPDHLARLRDRLDADPRIGAAQGKLYRVNPDAFEAGAPRPGGELDSAGHVIRRSRMVVDRGQGRPDGPAFDREVSVFSACGAALFLRRAMLEDLAPDGRYFDDAFFAYKEDIDLCWRARLLGWDVRYVPGAIGYHIRGWAGTGAPPKDRIPLSVRRHSWKNHYLLMLKNDHPLDVLRGLPAILGWEVVRHGYALLRDPRILLGHVDLARALPAALRERRALLRRRRASRVEMRRWFGTAEPRLVPASHAVAERLP